MTGERRDALVHWATLTKFFGSSKLEKLPFRCYEQLDVLQDVKSCATFSFVLRKIPQWVPLLYRHKTPMFKKLWLLRAKLFIEIMEKAEFNFCRLFPIKKNSFSYLFSLQHTSKLLLSLWVRMCDKSNYCSQNNRN